MFRASAKMHGTTSVDFDVCHRKASLREIVLRDLDLLFESQQFKTLIYLK